MFSIHARSSSVAPRLAAKARKSQRSFTPSPPIGALFEPIAIAAQNGLAELRKRGGAPSSDGAAGAPKPASAVPA